MDNRDKGLKKLHKKTSNKKRKKYLFYLAP